MPLARRITQIVVFALFLVLLLHAAAVVRSTAVPPEVVLRLSPLAGLTTLLGGQAFISRYVPAFVMLGLAVLFGRFFCGWVCPLGSTIDACDRALTPARKGRKPTFYDGRRLKYYLLALLLIGAPLGIRIAGWFDPLSLVTRSFTLVVVPYVGWLSNSLGLALQDLPTGALGQWWLRASRAALAEAAVPTYQYHVVFAILLLALLGVGVWYRRYWCRNLCPLGALLGIVSGRNLLRRSVDGKCISCHKCERACPMGCITDDGKGTLAGECILCLRCQEVCPTHAIHFIRPQPREQDAPVDLTKRGFVAALGATAAALPLLRLNTPRSRQKNRMTILRPPGARPEDDFLARCVRCGECMRVCPTRALQPAALEAGLEGLWAPQLVPRIGYCVYNCNLCGQVCPSQAIQKLTLDEKHSRAMGKAKFSRSRCIPWRGHARFREGLGEWKDCNCGTCEEACPVPGKAIRYNRFVGKVGDKEIVIDRPYVVEDLCIGCGFCENVCPVAGDAAVRVEGPAGTAVLDKEAPESAAVQLDDWSIEGWKLAAKPKAYVGGKQLYEYINGAGEPYIPYGFVQVTVARYQRGEEKLTVDLWQFKTSEGAFGAYSRDASNAATRKVLSPLPFASAGEGETWLWTGTHYLHVTDPDYQLPSDDLLEATSAIHGRIPKAASSLPAVVAALPKKSQVGASIHYFHHPLTVPEHAATPGRLLGTKGLAITATTPAAFALYGTLAKPTHGALIVDYPAEGDAAAAHDRATQVLASMGATIRTDGALTIAEREGNANVLVRKGTRLGAILRAKEATAAAAAARELLAGLE